MIETIIDWVYTPTLVIEGFATANGPVKKVDLPIEKWWIFPAGDVGLEGMVPPCGVGRIEQIHIVDEWSYFISGQFRKI